MQSAKLDRASASPNPIKGPSAAQAATYIGDMASSLRQLAYDHQLLTLAMLLEMAALQASNDSKPQV